jgi:transcriptional regulator with XRE-family HTH domain
MPNYETHPLRVIRRRQGLEMKELARLAGVSRATVSQIEEGRTKRPNERVIAVLARLSGEDPKGLLERVVSWTGQQFEDLVPRRAMTALQLPPEALRDLYPSFAAWRSEFADNPTRFASFLRINRLTVAKYERGGFVGGMPDSLVHALVARLGVSEEYLLALEELPVG